VIPVAIEWNDFTHLPCNKQALVGSILCYNTGRSLGQFVDLMQRCRGCVAVPDVLVTAVGTKVSTGS